MSDEIKYKQHTPKAGALVKYSFLDGTGTIKAVAFNQQIDKLSEILKLNETYYISGGTLQLPVSKGVLDTYLLELILNEKSVVKPYVDVKSEIPLYRFSFNFINLNEIKRELVNQSFDVCGTICCEPQFRTIPDHGDIMYFLIVDNTSHCIKINLWGEKLITEFDELFESKAKTILIKNIKCREYRSQLSLSSFDKTKIYESKSYENLPIVKENIDWYEKNKNSIKIENLNFFSENDVKLFKII